MGKLSNDQYSRRNENAAIRMIQNYKNPILTEEQHESLSNLCKARHELHSDKNHAIIEDYKGLKQAIITSNVDLLDSGLTPMYFVGTDISDYIDIDSLNEIDFDEDNYEAEYERISGELEKLNSQIENYLAQIDLKYGTNYAPTGAQRLN